MPAIGLTDEYVEGESFGRRRARGLPLLKMKIPPQSAVSPILCSRQFIARLFRPVSLLPLPFRTSSLPSRDLHDSAGAAREMPRPG
jgi:hypothetical protein